MLDEVLAWGLQPDFMTGDSWYSCVDNLKTVKNHRMGFMFAVESNRRVSTEKGTWVQVQKLDIPDDGMRVWLRDFGNVKLFRTRLKDQLRHYVVSLPDADAYDAFKQADFQALHDQHWRIGQYHRMIKQVCNIEKFPPQGWSMDSTRQSADTQPHLRCPLWLCPPATLNLQGVPLFQSCTFSK